MIRAAARTSPASYSKACDTFGASDYTAIGTGLGREGLVHLNELNPVRNRFVAEHFLEGTPTGIKHRLRHFRFGELRCRDIPDHDAAVGAHQAGRSFVKLIAAAVGDLGMDCSDALLAPSARRLGQRGLMLAIMLQRRDGFAVAAGRQRFQAKINADLAVACGGDVRHFNTDVEIPMPTCVLAEAAVVKIAVDWARQPETVAAPQMDNGIAINLDGARPDRNPSKRALRATAGAEAWAASRCVPREYKSPTNRRNRVGVQAKLSAGTAAQRVKINPRWPAALPFLRLPLYIAEIIPNESDRAGVTLQMASGAVFHAVAVGQDHRRIIHQKHKDFT